MKITNLRTVGYHEMNIDAWPHRRYPNGEWWVINGNGEWYTLTQKESKEEEAAFQKYLEAHRRSANRQRTRWKRYRIIGEFTAQMQTKNGAEKHAIG